MTFLTYPSIKHMTLDYGNKGCRLSLRDCRLPISGAEQNETAPPLPREPRKYKRAHPLLGGTTLLSLPSHGHPFVDNNTYSFARQP